MAATLITIGNVVSRKDAARLETKRLVAELRGLRIGAGLAWATSGRGGYDVWIEANENVSEDEKNAAVSAAVKQAERLRIVLR